MCNVTGFWRGFIRVRTKRDSIILWVDIDSANPVHEIINSNYAFHTIGSRKLLPNRSRFGPDFGSRHQQL
jgi:hypothetical protein